mmetsp:Transcript_1866/g.3212  ORF Transcript_1866/g.3212 Transcript_1866/m.3212 type:complete len:91 (-) Transcript_1866:991-1263(-)
MSLHAKSGSLFVLSRCLNGMCISVLGSPFSTPMEVLSVAHTHTHSHTLLLCLSASERNSFCIYFVVGFRFPFLNDANATCQVWTKRNFNA